jgi:hypothetical protein
MRKLPVIAAFIHALKSTWHNLPFAFQVSWPWMLFLIPFNLYFDAGFPDIDPTTTDPVKQLEIAKATLSFYALSVVSMIIYASIGVSWHRYILQDELPQGAARLRMDGTVWRYIGNTLMVAILAVFAVLPLAMIFSIVVQMLQMPLQALMPLYVALAVLIAMPVTYRFSIKLPAIAIGNKHFKFGDAWNATRENTPQLILLGVMVFAAMSILGIALGLVEQAVQTAMGEAGVFVFNVARHLATWIVAIFTITMLTSLYGYFVEKREF